MRMNDRLETPQVLTPSLLAITGFVIEIRFVPLDPQTLARIHARHALAGLGDKPLRPFAVLEVGHGHAPIGHGAIGIEKSCVAERSLGFQIPKSIKLPDTLVEEFLHLWVLRGDGEMNITGSLHQIRFLTRPFVKDLAVIGMAGKDFLIVGRYLVGIVDGRCILRARLCSRR